MPPASDGTKEVIMNIHESAPVPERNVATAKRPYATPRLRRLGTVADLTRSGGHSAIEGITMTGSHT